MSRRVVAVLTATLALGAPPLAAAQGAGDDQYSDPFAGEDQQQEESSSGSGDTSAPTPAPAPAPAAQTGTTTDTTAVEPTATTAATLPRTGPAAIWVTVAGVLALLAGAGLRRTVRT